MKKWCFLILEYQTRPTNNRSFSQRPNEKCATHTSTHSPSERDEIKLKHDKRAVSLQVLFVSCSPIGFAKRQIMGHPMSRIW